MESRRIRIGAVSYLNSKPLIHRLAEFAPQAELILDLPSRLAEGLAAERLDVALIPSIEYLRHRDYRIVSDACIACQGPVLSVKLFSRVAPADIQTLALDEGSRTSAVLVRILLKEQFGVTPAIEPLPAERELADSRADAVLLIGDRAIQSHKGRFAAVWDLGDEWCRWSQLPFVFAMWVAREGDSLGDVEQALTAARNAGEIEIEAIAAVEAASLGLTRHECLTYLRDNLHFHLGERERKGLELYRRLAVEHGFLDAAGSARPHALQT